MMPYKYNIIFSCD